MNLLEKISQEPSLALIATARGTLLVGTGKCRRMRCVPSDQAAFYFPDFFLEDSEPWLVYEEMAEYGLEDAIAVLKIDEVASSQFTWQQPNADVFKDEVVAVQASIAAGDLSKAVPYVCLQATRQLSSEQRQRAVFGAVMHSLRYGSTCYGFWDNCEGMIGATPELLATWRGDLLHTVACAGTALDPALLLRAKEQYEHALVIEGLRETLAPYGLFETDTTHTIQVGALYHLLTPVKVYLKGSLAWDEIISALHPTPALGAYPQAAGERWLRQYACRYPRRRYGAPVGYQLPGEERCCSVAIRQIQWDPQGLLLAAGCGITADSCAEEEWLEAQAKIKAIRTCLGV